MNEPVRGERRCAVGVDSDGGTMFAQYVCADWADSRIERLQRELAEARKIISANDTKESFKCSECGAWHVRKVEQPSQTSGELIPLFIECGFHGPPPDGFGSWNEWAAKRPLTGVRITSLSQPPRDNWICTNDRMPEIGQRILGHAVPKVSRSMEDSDGNPDVFKWNGHKWANQNSGNYLSDRWMILYWMPCPEDPRSPITKGDDHG